MRALGILISAAAIGLAAQENPGGNRMGIGLSSLYRKLEEFSGDNAA